MGSHGLHFLHAGCDQASEGAGTPLPAAPIMFSIHPSWPLVSIVALQEWFTKEYAIVGPKCFPVDADRMDLIAG
jgi:hypothetical protein